MPHTVARFAAVAVLSAAVAGLIGCQRGKAPPPQMPPAKVTVVKPVQYPVQSYFEYNGYLETTQSVEVRARVKGILTGVFFEEGSEVVGPDPDATDEEKKKGQRLYTIDDREYKTAVRKAEAELAKATADIGNWKAQIKLAESEVRRAETAASAVAAAQTDVDKAKATLGVNQAQLKAAVAHEEAAEAALHTSNILLGYTDIRARIGGRISRTLVDEGNLVGQSDPTLLTTIVRMDELYVFFDIPERDLLAYHQTAKERETAGKNPEEIPVEVGVTTEEGYPHRGRIDFRENRVDTGTGTISIRGRVPNPLVPPGNTRLLYPGLYARVRVPSGLPRPRPVIPEEAIQTGQEGRYVYVIGAENKVEKRVVTVGAVVWKAPPADRKPEPGWTMANPRPVAPPEGGDAGKPASGSGSGGSSGGSATPPGKGAAPPEPAILPANSVVAIEKGLEPNDRVIVIGLQKARPGAEVKPDEWEFRAPAAPKAPEKK